MSEDTIVSHRSGLLAVLGDEGFRLFFPLAALYAAVWPLLWVLALGFDLPLARAVPPSLWHAHEMLVGAYGAALIGFLTTAIPEWTDTERLRGRALFTLALLWGIGRAVGVLGWDGASLVGALADLAWLILLLAYVLRVSWMRRSDRLSAFAFWLLLLAAAALATRWSFAVGDIALAATAVRVVGFAYLGLLGLALARITVPVTNLVLDPSEETSPFRPHPGRKNLAPGLVLVVMAAEVAGVSAAVSGFLFVAAGAAFMDRVGESFIGRKFLRAEILMLAGAAAMAGAGMIMVGASRLGAPWAETTGLHLAFMGGLGLSVLAVFCIAGLLHTGQPLGLSGAARAAALCLLAGTILRVLPDLGMAGDLIGGPYALPSILWAAGFLIWLASYWPALKDASTCGGRRC